MTMPSLWSLLHAPTVELLGWTLLHFVWQGALVAAVLAGALSLLRSHSPRVRYAVSGAALLGLFALPIGTGVFLSGSVLSSASAPSPSMIVVENGAELTAASRASVAEPAAATAPSWRAWAAARVQPALPWVVLAWSFGVLVFAMRLGGGAWRVRRLRRTSTAAPSEWQDRLQALADRMGVGPSVALRRSEQVEGPVLAGWWRPVILVPAGFLSGLPPAQVEALLLHELAHVRRHDVLVGRLQAVVETLLFFHPATWWISKQVRRAREACCDDLVVRAGSGRKTYAQALTALAERTVAGSTTAWTPAAADGSLLDRIQRLVAPPEAPSTAGRRLSMVVAAVLMVTVPAALAACASQQSTTAAESPQATVQTEQDTKDLGEKETPEPSEELPAAAEEEMVVVVRDDSTERSVVVGPDSSSKVDGHEENVFVVRENARVDTVDFPELEDLKQGLSFSPDSLERALRMQLDPDSLERVILGQINPDSIERAVRMRFDPDSLEQRVLRMRLHADSLAQRFSERFSDDWSEHWQDRGFADSTFAFEFDGFDPDDFNREDFDRDLDVDSLIRRHQKHADSLRRHFEQMHERRAREAPEQLREEARRLRERAERLEERAEEMETPPDSSG